MTRALDEFHNTPEEHQLTICHAKIVLARGEVDRALELLKVNANDCQSALVYTCAGYRAQSVSISVGAAEDRRDLLASQEGQASVCDMLQVRCTLDKTP